MNLKARKPKIVALVLAAGEGARAQSRSVVQRTAVQRAAAQRAAAPKAYRLVAGADGLAPMLRHSVHMLLRQEQIAAVRCVIHPAHRLLYAQACEGLKGNLLAPILGGASRYHSARLGVQSLKRHKPELVLLHDAARPFASPQLVRACCAALMGKNAQTDGACAALPMVDALKSVRRGKLIAAPPSENLWRAQTPQVFRYAKLLAAYDALGDAPEPLPRDDSEAAQRAGLKVACVAGESANEKLTFAADFVSPPSALPPLRRIGLGFDSHAFAKDAFAKGNALQLGGARIPAPHGVRAHSDGDVLLHALCDALYGALAAGDIGVHFPPSEARNKGRASADFLRHALAQLKARGGRLQQIDMVLIADAPKLAPHRAAIVKSLCALLRACDSPLPQQQIGFKATTTEGLGTAPGRGIAAWVMVGIA